MFSGSVRRIATVLTADDRATGKLRRTEQAGDDVADSMERTERRANALRGALIGTAAGAAGLGLALGMLTRRHGQTEQVFSRLEVLTGATDEEMEGLRQTALQLGIDLPLTMRDSAQAMEQLAFAGFSAEEAMQAAAGVGDLATASSLSVAESSRTAASALRMFNLEADQMVQVNSALAATFSNSASNIRELADALSYTGATASAAGIPIAEMTAAIGVLADQGIRASRAGTALNATITRIASGTGRAQDALDKLGLSMEDFTDAEGNFRSLQEILVLLGDRMENLEGNAARMAVATDLAGLRGARALLPLIQSTEELNRKIGDIFRSEIRESIGTLSQLSAQEIEGVEEALGMEIDPENVTPQAIITRLEEMEEQGVGVAEMSQRLQVGLNISAGAAQALAQDVHNAQVSTDQLAESIGGATTASGLAASQMDTAAGAVEFLRGSVDALTFTIFTGAKPAIKSFAQDVAGLVEFLNSNEEAMKALGAALPVLAGGFTVLALAIGAAYAQILITSSLLPVLSASFLGTAASAYAAGGALGVLSAGAGAASAAFGVLSAVLLTTPLGWVLLAITAVVAAIAGLVAIMKGDLFGAGDEAAAVLGFLGDAAGKAGAIIGQLLGILGELVRIGATLAGLALLAPLAAALNAFDAFTSGKGIVESLLAGLNSIGPAKYLLPIIGPLLFAKDVASDPGRWIEMGRDIVGSIVAGLDSLGPAKYLIPILGPLLLAKDIISDPGRWIGMGRDILDGILSGLDELGPMKYALPILGPLLLAKDIISDPGRWIEAGKQIPRSIANGIKALASSPVDAVAGIAGDIRSRLPFSPAEQGPLSDLDKVGPALVQTIAGGVKGEQSTMKSAIANVLQAHPLVQGAGFAFDTITGAVQGATGGGSGPTAVEIVLEQTNNFSGDAVDDAELRRRVREATRDGGQDALAELELLLRQSLDT